MSVSVPMSPVVAPLPLTVGGPAAEELDEAFFLKEVARILAEARREARGDDGTPSLPGSTTQW